MTRVKEEILLIYGENSTLSRIYADQRVLTPLIDPGMLSEESRQLILRKLDELSREFSSHHQQDLALPLEKRMNVGLMFAYRPWEFSVFRKMRRNRQSADA